ncbi:O-antigen ligase [Bacillus sp. JCM 19034]|uniref:O-antigen ligase family protein n=1 Tax=Bacillus sp. JCM 19034 TaxID=1481928 RepID=UPI000783BAD0|nr:O-antigen ligase family protein [Bacillus sp. JCM 19034]
MEVISKQDEAFKKGTIYNLGYIQKLILLIFFIVVFNLDFQIQIIWWGVHGLLFVGLLLYLLKTNFSIKKDTLLFIGWYNSFVLLSIFSLFWSVNNDFTMIDVNRLIVTSFSLSCISIMCCNKSNFHWILKLYLYANLINVIYIINTLGISGLTSGRLGVDNLGDSWNSNYIGIVMAITAFIAYFLYETHKKGISKTFFLLAIIGFNIIVIMTGSRTALFISLFMITIFFYLNTRKKIASFFFITISSLFILYSVFNIPFIYESIGYRLDSFFNVFSNDQSSIDGSTMIRRDMISLGLAWFKESPFLGHGANSYRELYGLTTGWYTYSHNTYVELLVGIGIIGLVVYFYPYFTILKKSLRAKSQYSLFAISIIVTLLIAHFTMVGYFRFEVQLLICLGFRAVILAQNNDLRKGLEM